MHFASHQELDARQDLADEDDHIAFAVFLHAPVAEKKVDCMLTPELLRWQARRPRVTERTRGEPCQAEVFAGMPDDLLQIRHRTQLQAMQLQKRPDPQTFR